MGIMLLKYLGFGGSKNTSSSKKRYPTVIEELCHQFSLEDLRKSTNNFDEKLLIGRGCFGNVYKGCLKHNGATDYTIALKLVNQNCSQGFPQFKKEIELLCQLRHPNLISLIGFCNRKKEKILVYEYMPNGSLGDYLHNRDIEPLPWKKRLEICIGSAHGLHYLQTGAKRTIFHRDIKPNNILLDSNMVPKLSNFWFSLQGALSMSKPKKIEVDRIIGSHTYMAPEYRMHGIVTDKCDVFSFGVVLLQMIWDNHMIINKANMLANQQWGERGSEDLPEFTGSSIPTLDIMIFPERFPIEEIIDPTVMGKIAPECWEVFIGITQRCLKAEPDERPTMGEVEVLLEHALSLQEEADIRRTDGDYTLLSTTYIDYYWRRSICIYDQEADADSSSSGYLNVIG